MSEEFNSVTCNTCGIKFKFLKEIEDLWRKSEKTFHCPNGHGLVWNKPKESAEETELKKLRAEVKTLTEKLATSEKKTEDYKKRAEELAAELEIWRPTTNDEKKDV